MSRTCGAVLCHLDYAALTENRARFDGPGDTAGNAVYAGMVAFAAAHLGHYIAQNIHTGIYKRDLWNGPRKRPH